MDVTIDGIISQGVISLRHQYVSELRMQYSATLHCNAVLGRTAPGDKGKVLLISYYELISEFMRRDFILIFSLFLGGYGLK